MSTAHRPDSFEFTDYLKVLRRRWLIVVGVIVLAVVATVGYLKVAPKVYTASTEVSVTPTGAPSSQVGGGGARTASAVNMDNEAQLVQSLTVASIAAKLLDSPLTPQALGKQVKVAVPANSQVLQISCDASTAKGSAECANAFAQAYLSNRQDTAQASINSQLQTLQKQIDSVSKHFASLTAKIAELPANSQQHAIDESQLTSYTSQLHALNAETATLIGDGANSSGGSVIGKASPPGAPSSPRKMLILPSGVIAGLLLAVLLALLADRRDDRIYGPDDAERAMDAPVLLNVSHRKTAAPLGLLSPRSRAGYGLTELARGLAASLGGRGHLIFVTGTSDGGASALTSVNLAAALARNYGSTILLSPNLRTGLAPQVLGLDRARGLAELLGGSASYGEVVKRPADIPKLQVITSGVEQTAGGTDYEFDALASLVRRLREESRYVVIEDAGGPDSTEAFAIAEFADAAVVVVENGRTTKSDAAVAARRLDQVHTTVLGSVLLWPADVPAKWRDPLAETVRVLPDRSEQQTRPVAASAAANSTTARRRPASRPTGRLGAQEPPSSIRAPRDPSQTLPLPRLNLPTEKPLSRSADKPLSGPERTLSRPDKPGPRPDDKPAPRPDKLATRPDPLSRPETRSRPEPLPRLDKPRPATADKRLTAQADKEPAKQPRSAISDDPFGAVDTGTE
jgi:succinoglycan biosynthesis transport protein ExoP